MIRALVSATSRKQQNRNLVTAISNADLSLETGGGACKHPVDAVQKGVLGTKNGHEDSILGVIGIGNKDEKREESEGERERVREKLSLWEDIREGPTPTNQ